MSIQPTIIQQTLLVANHLVVYYNSRMLSTQKKWLEYSLPVMEKIRKELVATDAVLLGARSGASYTKSQEGHGEFALDYFDESYLISYPQFEARDRATGKECPPGLLFFFLHYLHAADGTAVADRWIGYRELPDGVFYSQAFQGYSGARLISAFGNDLARFKEAALRVGGEPLSFGDAAFMVRALPRVPLAIVYWLGDEEFPPHASVLFDASAGHYLSTDALAVLGRELCSKVIAQNRQSGE